MKPNTCNKVSTKDKLGQFFTTPTVIEKYMENIDISNFDILIEPSFGSGNFLEYFKKNNKNKHIGIELSEEFYKEFENIETFNMNFYDWKYNFNNKKVAFIGNPPYRTPAYSLETHKPYIKNLLKKYNIKGIKEESVFFLIETFDKLRGVDDFEIIYILPKTIFQNQSSNFDTFRNFLLENLNLISVQNLQNCEFLNVDQDLVMVRFNNKKQSDNILLDGIESPLKNFYNIQEDYYDYRFIFKRGKTSLGSVPMESIFFSINDESKEHFLKRLNLIFFSDGDIVSNLQYNGKYHLKILNTTDEEKFNKKMGQILGYIQDIKDKRLISLEDLADLSNIKNIKNRNKDIFYLRLNSLKKVNGVYILNSNPGKSFYFTTNPTKSSTDYYGFCEYDVNRNSTPGSIRTVLSDDVHDVISDEFKIVMDKNNIKHADIFKYIIYTYKSEWYKRMKTTYNRFYFGVPKELNSKDFYKNL